MNTQEINKIKDLCGILTEEKDLDTMYVEYAGEYPDEEPFIIDGRKYEYCYGIYPSGKKDIAVYSYAGDVTYGYGWFQKIILNKR